MNKPVLLRITTVPNSFRGFLQGQLKYLNTWFAPHACSSPGWQLDELAKNEEIPVHEIAMARTPSVKRDISSLIRLVSLMKEIRPTIVHTETPKAGLLGMMAARIAGVPIRVHTVSGCPWMETTGVKRKILMGMERLTYYFATGVYSNSQNLRKYLISQHLIKSQNISVIGHGTSNGVNTEHYKNTDAVKSRGREIKYELGWSDEDFVILFIGRLVKDKGVVELVDVFKKLNQKYPRLRLLLVGSPEPERDALPEHTIEAIKNHSNIRSTGFVLDVRPYFSLSDILAFPSYREGFPNVPLQAACFGLPMIVTDINGCNEIVSDQQNGIIIPTKNEDALLNSIELLINNSVLRHNLGRNALDNVVDKYDQANFWELLLQEYQALMKQAGI